MTPEPKIEWCQITTVEDTSMIGRIVRVGELYGQKMLEFSYKKNTGETMTAYIFVDHITSIVALTEAQAEESVPMMPSGMLAAFNRVKDALKSPQNAVTNPCTNGTCQKPQAADCTNLFCAECCEEKCLGDCIRAVKDALAEDTPNF
jgi:hypothetical protein